MVVKSVKIRVAEEGDGKQLKALWLQMHDELSRGGEHYRLSDDAADRVENDIRDWIQNRTTGHLLVAVEADTVVGFSHAVLYYPIPVISEGVEVFLEELFVVPEWRRLGAGKKMVEEVVKWAKTKRARRLCLRTPTANELGLKFWKSVGAAPRTLELAIDLPGISTENEKVAKLGFSLD